MPNRHNGRTIIFPVYLHTVENFKNSSTEAKHASKRRNWMERRNTGKNKTDQRSEARGVQIEEHRKEEHREGNQNCDKNCNSLKL